MIVHRRAGICAVQVRAVARRVGPEAAIGKENIDAVDAGLIAAERQLGAAVLVHADVTGMAPVYVVEDDIDTITVWSAAGPAGGGGRTRRLLAARDEGEGRSAEERKSDRVRSHGLRRSLKVGSSRLRVRSRWRARSGRRPSAGMRRGGRSSVRSTCSRAPGRGAECQRTLRSPS